MPPTLTAADHPATTVLAQRIRNDAAILAARAELYGRAKKRAPRRWSGNTRNWTPVGPVSLNKLHPTPGREEPSR
jgi:hypothetical protein